MAIAFIPARANSKGLPGKNKMLCGGKPLYRWSIEAAEQSKNIEKIILSTDDPDLLLEPTALQRPVHLAQDESSTLSVVSYLIDSLKVYEPMSGQVVEDDLPKDGLFVLLQPTSPLRTGKHIDEAISLLQNSEASCVVGVQRTHNLLWEESKEDGAVDRSPTPMATKFGHPLYSVSKRPRRQEMSQFSENGALYVFTYDLWKNMENYLGGRIALYEMGDIESLQIDTEFDMWLCDQVMKRQQSLWSTSLLT